MNSAGDKEQRRNGEERERIPRGIERRLTLINNRLESRDLFVGTRDIVILHGADAYHLRLTAQNKLILTK